MSNETETNNLKTKRNANGIFMLTVGSIAAVVGFGYAYLSAKRNEIEQLTSHQTSQKVREQMALMRDGNRLASRALAYSWLWSIGGVSFIALAAWKVSGAKDLAEFRKKAGETLPVIPKSTSPGRGNFESLKDLADYLEQEDKKKIQIEQGSSKCE